ncbi:MAG: bile acid:sodium symporter [Thermoleophilaceae bacterium]
MTRLAAVAAGAVAIALLNAAPALAAAESTSDDSSIFSTTLLPLSLAVIMISLGLSLTPADFARVLKFPKGVGIGLVNLLVISPLLAFTVAEIVGLEAGLAVGLVLLGASPGGTTANLLTHVARGDTALSITMTAISSVAAVITVPLYLGIAIDHFGASFPNDPDMAGVAAKVFFITVVPLSIGMWIRARRTEWAIRREGRAKQIALGLFVFVVGGSIANESEAITDHFAELALATLGLNLAAMAISFNIARAARLSRPQSTAIAMELGVHNGTVAITVGAGIATILASPAAVYSVFMFVTAGIFARVMYKRNAAEEDEGVVSERELPVETRRPAPVPVATGGTAVAVAEPEPVPAPAALPDEPEPASRPHPGVRAHPGSGFWRVMTGAAIAFAGASLLLTLLAIAGVG